MHVKTSASEKASNIFGKQVMKGIAKNECNVFTKHYFNPHFLNARIVFVKQIIGEVGNGVREVCSPILGAPAGVLPYLRGY